MLKAGIFPLEIHRMWLVNWCYSVKTIVCGLLLLLAAVCCCSFRLAALHRHRPALPPDRLTRLPASPIPWVLPPRQSASELRSLAEVPPPPTTPQRGDGLGGRKPFRTDNRHFVCLSPHCASECACRDPVFLQPWGLVKEGWGGGGAATGGWPFQQLSLGECNLSQSALLSYSLLPNTWDALWLLYYRANFWPTHTHIHYSMFTLIVTLKASCRRLQEAAGSFLLGRTPSGEAEIFCGTIVCLRDDQLFCALLTKFDTEVSERTLPLLGRVSSFDENMPRRDS